jgi:phosphoglycerate dehydrogenase-like enzyme
MYLARAFCLSIPDFSFFPQSRKHRKNLSSMIDPNVTPSFPIDAQPTIGLIGMGAMGRMYAEYLSRAGWRK